MMEKAVKHIREGFKMSELGEIPTNWRILSSEEIVVPEKSAIKIGPFGSQLKKETLTDEGYKVYGQENVFKNDFTLGKRFVNEEKYNQLKTCELLPNDFVITMMGTIGKCAIVPEDADVGIMDSHLLRLRLDEQVYKNDLLLHVIKSELIQKQIQKLSVGGIMDGLSSKVIRQIKFPVPSLQEQQKISDILSTIDTQVVQLDSLIDKTKELKKGLMQQLLTKGIAHTEFKQTELGEIPVSWSIRNLDEIAEVKGGKRLPKGHQLLEEDTGFPYIRVSDMRGENIQLDNIMYVPTDVVPKISNYRIYVGELFISVAGTLGLIGEVPESLDGANLTENADRICNIQIDKNYLKYFLLSNMIQNVIDNVKTTSAQPKLALKQIKNFKILIPSQEEQKKISLILTAVDEQVISYEEEKTKYEELKKGLMQQLLTGQLRVKV